MTAEKVFKDSAKRFRQRQIMHQHQREFVVKRDKMLESGINIKDEHISQVHDFPLLMPANGTIDDEEDAWLLPADPGRYSGDESSEDERNDVNDYDFDGAGDQNSPKKTAWSNKLTSPLNWELNAKGGRRQGAVLEPDRKSVV